MAMHFALRRNYRIQMVMAKSNSLCGAPLVAAAALGTEMGFVRLGGGGVALHPPTPHPFLAWRGVCGGIAHLEPHHLPGVRHGVQPAAGTFAGISRVRVYVDLC